MRSKPTNSWVTPTQVLTDNVSATGMAINAMFLRQAGNLSVSSCDDLLHALNAAEAATRKLRVRLAQEGGAK
jgi:hypothetical protein